MDCIEVTESTFTADQIVAASQLEESARLHAGRYRAELRLAKTLQLAARDLGIFDAHVQAYHASEHYIPF